MFLTTSPYTTPTGYVFYSGPAHAYPYSLCSVPILHGTASYVADVPTYLHAVRDALDISYGSDYHVVSTHLHAVRDALDILYGFDFHAVSTHLRAVRMPSTSYTALTSMPYPPTSMPYSQYMPLPPMWQMPQVSCAPTFPASTGMTSGFQTLLTDSTVGDSTLAEQTPAYYTGRTTG